MWWCATFSSIFNNYHSDICIRFFLNIFTKFINLFLFFFFFFCCLSFMMLLWQFLYVFLWFFIYIQHLAMNKMIHFSHFYDLILLFFYILKNSFRLFGFVCFEIMKLIILFISIIIRIINIISFWNGKCLENWCLERNRLFIKTPSKKKENFQIAIVPFDLFENMFCSLILDQFLCHFNNFWSIFPSANWKLPVACLSLFSFFLTHFFNSS